MKHIKRATALCLFAALIFGFFGGIPILSFFATDADAAATDIEGNPIVNLMDGMNASFEELTIPGWSVMEGVVQSDEKLYGEGGNWSLKLNDSSKTAATWSISDKNTINPGEKYTISAQVYGGIGQMTVYFYDADGKELSDKTVTLATAKAANSWQSLSQEFTADANAASLAVKVSSTASGTEAVWFDAVTLASNAGSDFALSLENGSFDAEWTSYIAPGWINKGSAKTKFERIANGTGYAMAVTRAADAAISFRCAPFAVLPDMAYTFSIDVKLKTSNSLQVLLYFYDKDGNLISSGTQSNIYVGDYSDGWYTAMVNAQAPSNAATADVLITDPGKTDTGVYYFDNATISMPEELFDTSFEGITNRYGVPVAIYGTNTGSYINTNADYVRTGKQSVITTYTTSQTASVQLRSRLMNVKEGEVYEASVYVKREAGYTDDCAASVYIIYYGSDGTELKRVYGEGTPVSSEWIKISKSCQAPAGAVTARILFYKTAGSGNCYFDDLSLVQTTDYKLAKNYLTNGGFESRTIAKYIPVAQWEGTGTAATDSYALDYIGGDYGYSARVFNTTYALIVSQPIPITVGESYSVTVEAKGEGRLQAYIRYYGNDEAKRTEYMKDSTDKDLGKFASTSNLTKDTWTQLAVSGSVAPEGAKYVRIWLVATKDSFTGNINFNFDNVVFFNGIPKLEIPGETGEIWNPSFEELNEGGMPVKWNTFGQNRLSIADSTVDPDDVYDGRYALKINVPADLSGTHGAQCEPFPVEAGVTYRFSLYAKEDYDQGRGFQLGIKYFDKYGSQIAAFYSTTPATGEWNYCDVTGAAPDSAVYATVYLVSGAGKGTVVFDKLAFEPAGSSGNAPVMFEKDDWEIVYNEYPRLDFDQEGLEQIQRFSKSKSVCAYGYAGTVTLKSLLKTADQYLEETKMSVAHKGITLEYKLHPVLEDPTCRVEFETPPDGFSTYPYMTAVGQQLVSRVQTLALAYAITGEAKYGERAVQYALDICDFKYWVGYWNDIVMGSGEQSSQTTGYMVDCVIAAYDMCYDLLSDADKAKMEKNLIEKGLETMYQDCWARMQRDRDMDHATGMILAACTILREDNKDQLEKYLNMGMTYINWRLNFFLNSGVNEGNMYDSLAIDDIVVTLYTLERVTGYTGPLDHPYMEELQTRVLGFFDMVNGTLPAYSDSDFSSHYYPYSMAVFSQQGNMLATYYLAVGGALSSDYDKLVWFTDVNIAELETPDERERNVNYLGSHGQASLRTGWDLLDSMLIINANNSQQEHNHYDQNSILLAFNGLWLLSDSEYKDNSYSELTTWQMKYTNSTIFVDGKPQVRKGQGTLEQVFSTHVYGYFLGSAPGAYGMEDKQQVLNKFDRHVIMVNHDSQPYYVIIDDLDSNKERNFGWNMYTNGWDRLEMDGENVPEGTSATGNRVTLSRFGCTLHSYFVGGQVTTNEVSYASYGPTLVLESEKATNYQFMNVLSVQKGSGSQISTLFEHMMTGQSSTIEENIVEGEISWSTRRSDTTKNAILSVSIGSPLVMFRAGEVGDWISFPFDVPTTKEYRVSVDVGQTLEYNGTWNLYIDGELIEIFKPNGPSGIMTIDAGKMTLEAGQHTVKIILSGTPASAFTGTICSVGGITLDTGESMGEGTVKVVESYDEGDLLGAKITYGPVLEDIVLFNRGTGEISASGLTTNGQQASVIGLNGSDIAEGYAVTKGTSLKYGDQVLVTAESPVSIAMDYTMAKYPVKNDDTEDPVEIHEDFDIEVPVYYVSSKADAATKTSINVGIHAPYTAYIDGEEVESTHEGVMLTLTIPEGEHQITIVGTHQHTFDQYATNILNIKEWADCENGNVYYISCECGENGTETFVDGDPKGHTLTAVPAKEATDTENGNIAHWKCKKCGKLFADADGTKELSANDVILLSTANTIWLIVGIAAGVLVLAGAGVVVFIILKKKKKQAGETPAEEVPAEEVSTEETPAEETPVEETPTEE